MLVHAFLALVVASLPSVQDPTPAPPPVAAAPAKTEPAPGEIPANASAEAKALWLGLVQTQSGAATQPKVAAFELFFDSRVWQGENETNFDQGRIRFLAPSFVDSGLEPGGRRRLRGPRGDWLVDSKGVSTRLQGFEGEKDRKEIDRIVHVARTFVNLVDPKSVRLRSLATLSASPSSLPASLAERAKGLKWLDVSSPDFAFVTAEGTASKREVRAWIGLDAATKLPQLAILTEQENGRTIPESALLVVMGKYKALDALQVPFELTTYAADGTSGSWRFAEKPSLALWLIKGSLRAKLAPADFEPPKK